MFEKVVEAIFEIAEALKSMAHDYHAIAQKKLEMLNWDAKSNPTEVAELPDDYGDEGTSATPVHQDSVEVELPDPDIIARAVDANDRKLMMDCFLTLIEAGRIEARTGDANKTRTTTLIKELDKYLIALGHVSTSEVSDETDAVLDSILADSQEEETEKPLMTLKKARDIISKLSDIWQKNGDAPEDIAKDIGGCVAMFSSNESERLSRVPADKLEELLDEICEDWRNYAN